MKCSDGSWKVAAHTGRQWLFRISRCGTPVRLLSFSRVSLLAGLLLYICCLPASDQLPLGDPFALGLQILCHVVVSWPCSSFPGSNPGCCFLGIVIVLWDTVSSGVSGLADMTRLARETRGSACLYPPTAGFISMATKHSFFMGVGKSSSVPHACEQQALYQWNISPDS